MKIRGIDLDVLRKSRLMPQLPAFYEAFGKRPLGPEESLKKARFFLRHMSTAFFIGIMVFILWIAKPSDNSLIISFGAIQFIAVLAFLSFLIARKEVKKFTGLINKLDRMLPGKGIVDLPKFYQPMVIAFQKILVESAKSVLILQDENPNSEERNETVQEFRKLHEIIQELGFTISDEGQTGMGDHKIYFDEAKKLLEQEKVAEKEKEIEERQKERKSALASEISTPVTT